MGFTEERRGNGDGRLIHDIPARSSECDTDSAPFPRQGTLVLMIMSKLIFCRQADIYIFPDNILLTYHDVESSRSLHQNVVY